MAGFFRAALMALGMAVSPMAVAEQEVIGPHLPKTLEEAAEMLLKSKFAVPVRCLSSTVSSSEFTHNLYVGIMLFGTGPSAVPVLKEKAPELARRAFEYFQSPVAKFASEGGFDHVNDPPALGSPEAKAVNDRLMAFYDRNGFARPSLGPNKLTIHLRQFLPENTLKLTTYKWQVTPEDLPGCDDYEE